MKKTQDVQFFNAIEKPDKKICPKECRDDCIELYNA